MSGFETIEITVKDGQFRKIENWKWPIIQWSKLEQTWSYLRRKYGTFKKKMAGDSSSWVKE